MASFTPGPWTANEDVILPRSRLWVQTDVRAGREAVATCCRTRAAISDADAAEVRANARLIAAAPDLLAELQRLLAWFDAESERVRETGTGSTEGELIDEAVRIKALVLTAKGGAP